MEDYKTKTRREIPAQMPQTKDFRNGTNKEMGLVFTVGDPETVLTVRLFG